MGRPLEGKAEAKSVVRSALTLHRVDDLGVEKKEFRAGYDIGIHIAMIPRHLHSPASVQPEK